MNNMVRFSFLVLIALGLSSCNQTTLIRSGDLQIEFDKNLYSRINSNATNADPLSEEFRLSDFLETKNFKTDKFVISDMQERVLDNNFGQGQEWLFTGTFKYANASLEKRVSVQTYKDLENCAVFNISYINSGEEDISIKKWSSHNYAIEGQDSSKEMWSFQGSSTDARADWILPIRPGFYQKNFMGMNQSDYGGGIPVTDVWRKDAGIALGHLSMYPQEVSLPVDYDQYESHAQIGIEYDFGGFEILAAGDTLHTQETFVMVHEGDYFTSMRRYSELMQLKGIEFAESEPHAFESVWCGWGYERKFTVDNIIGTLPKVKELGIQWAVIDDGFQIAEGDWRVDKRRFPGGSKDMKRMVRAIHDHGLKAKLWWAPLAADPGSKILEDHSEAMLINKDGGPQFITWWNSFYLSPASQATMDHTLETVEMFMKEWDFDGLKMDGQHMNAVPADHNWKSPLEYPEKSIEMLPEFFKIVYETAREIKPHAVIENCPCGTCMSFHNMPYTNQTVSSDPTSSWQIRLKGKTYKAIMPQTAYYGDHVELSDEASDFASSFGVGAVLGTKFTWPKDNPTQDESQLLSPEKEEKWKLWFNLYHDMMLSKEEYLGQLYDIGFDKPETHVIVKGNTMYYSFYGEEWSGEIELKGLDPQLRYSAYDYVNEVKLGDFAGAKPFIDTEFKNYLLIEVHQTL